MGQRELKYDRLTSIDKCQAKGGPLNCRYHSGILLDEVDALTGSKNTNVLVTAARGNVFDDSDESFLVKMAQDKVGDTVTRLLDVYTIDNNKSKHFYYTDDNGKQHDYTDDDIIGIRHSLYHIQEALHEGHSNGKTLETCVKDFNKRIGFSTTDTYGRRHLDRIHEPYYNDDISRSAVENIFCENARTAPTTTLNMDGSLNIDAVLTPEEQKQAIDWWQTRLYQKHAQIIKDLNDYQTLEDELLDKYPPESYDTQQNRLTNRMSKNDVPSFWDYITHKVPGIEDKYNQHMHQQEPKTVQDLQDFINLYNSDYIKGTLLEDEYRFNELLNQVTTNGLPPAGIYYAHKARILEQYNNKTHNEILKDVKDLSKQETVNNEYNKHPYDKDWQVSNYLFLDTLKGRVKTTNYTLNKKLTDYSINWDMHILSRDVYEPKGTKGKKYYDIDLDTTHRTVHPNGTRQYQVKYHTDRYADMSDDSRYWGNDKYNTLIITYSPNTTTPIIQIEKDKRHYQ